VRTKGRMEIFEKLAVWSEKKAVESCGQSGFGC
jgi:hypothetical protein